MFRVPIKNLLKIFENCLTSGYNYVYERYKHQHELKSQLIINEENIIKHIFIQLFLFFFIKIKF